jgi:glycosyltransferase involved in cell wall biosynthesis
VNNYHSSLVSVIIPTYNAEKFIERTLNSVIDQTFLNIEVLVVDDGSQDRTAEIVKAIAQKDSRIILLQQENAGVAAARNLAIEKSQGEYIAPIDADDIWYPQNLEKQVQCMLQADSSVGVVYSWSVDIDEEDRLTGGFYNSNLQGDIRAALVYKYFIGNASSSLIRRACFEKVGGYNRKLKEKCSRL